MSKDFYSNDHIIQVGAPGSGDGKLELKTEGDFEVDATGSVGIYGFETTLYGYNSVTVTSDSVANIYAEGEVSISTGDGSSLYIGSDIQSNRRIIITDGGSDITGNVDITGDVDINGSLIVSGSITGSGGLSNAGDISISTTNGGDINLTATGVSGPLGNAEVNITAAQIDTNSSAATNLTIGTDLAINVGDDINIKAGISDAGNISLQAGTAITSPALSITESSGTISLDCPVVSFSIDNGLISSGGFWNVSCDYYTLSGSNSNYMFRIASTSSSSTADLMKLSFDNITTPNLGNNWIQFLANGSSRGSIQGASAGSNFYAVYAAGKAAGYQYAVRDDGDPFTTLDGDVQYASGNQDFGEWIAIGDESEWNLTEEVKEELKKGSVFPVEEGVILYVRDSKVWRSGPGRGMVVTQRAIVVGNQNFKEDGKLGIIMSFIGQVPTYVEGTVEDGDLLVPVEGTNHCKAINPDQISFADYRKAVGTAWGKKLTSEIGRVNCAIGVK